MFQTTFHFRSVFGNLVNFQTLTSDNLTFRDVKVNTDNYYESSLTVPL